MRVYYDQGRAYSNARLHPYNAGDEYQSGYVDFKAKPALISQTLEDFKPFDHWNGVQKFYEILHEINGSKSYLETCDCAFRGPNPHQDSHSDLKLSVHGRLFLLFRDLQLNCSAPHSDWLCARLQKVLTDIEPDMTEKSGVVGFSLCPALHTDLSNGSWHEDGTFDCEDDDPGYGHHLMLSFWAYGDDESMVDANLYRVFENIGAGCRSINTEIDITLEMNSVK